MTDLAPVRRALISVSDKTDLIPFAQALDSLGVELVSTGGTARALEEAGITVRTVDSVTGFPEIMQGRVKTLHPRIHGAVLARRDEASHVRAMDEHGIEPIDLVCVNLYPFERTIRGRHHQAGDRADRHRQALDAPLRGEECDFVTVVTSSDQYDRLINELKSQDCHTTRELRADFAAAAFNRTAEYDAAISAWMGTSRKPGSRRPDSRSSPARASATARTPQRPCSTRIRRPVARTSPPPSN